MDVVEQLRGRMKFYHVGDPTRKDMDRACGEIDDLRIRDMLTEALIKEANERLAMLQGQLDMLQAQGGRGAGFTAASVGDWLGGRGVKLLPWQRKKLGLDPTTE
jgi:DNA-binding LacI/PurR family transcriptional regulator